MRITLKAINDELARRVLPSAWPGLADTSISNSAKPPDGSIGPCVCRL
jgi:hypothetical protein